MNDDYSNDIFTDGLILVGGPFVDGVNESTNDDDWFKINLDAYYTYKFVVEADSNSSTPANLVTFRVLDNSGDELRRSTTRSLSRDEFFKPIDRSGDFFISMRAGDGAYRINAQIVDDFPDFPTARRQTDRSITGAIETIDDNDFITFMLARNTTYSISLYGDGRGRFTLDDPQLELWRSNNLVDSDDNSGPGNAARIVVRPDVTTDYRIRISGVNDSTGSWNLVVHANDDFAEDNSTTGRLNFVSGLTSRQANVFGTFEFVDDNDWFRVELEAGHWYNVRALGGGTEVIDSDNNILHSIDSFGNLKFFSEFSGTHFITAKHGTPQFFGSLSYNLTVFEIVPRIVTSEIRATGSQSRTIADYTRWNIRSSPSDQFEVFSHTKLRRGGNPVEFLAANQYHVLTRAEFEELQVPGRFRGESQLWVRAQPSVDDNWTNWNSIAISGGTDLPAINGQSTARTIRYNFADELPAYYNEGTTFHSALNGNERRIVRRALGYWTRATGIAFREEAFPPDFPDRMSIFKSGNTTGHVVGTSPGIDSGYDLRFNAFSQVMKTRWIEGSRSFFEIVRGIGQSLGLRTTTHWNRLDTVMGRRFGNDVDGITFGFEPTSSDALSIQKVSGITRAPRSTNNDIYKFEGRPFLKTILDDGGLDWISAAGMNHDVRIDLQPGRRSFMTVDGQQKYTYINAFDSSLERAAGGNGNDALIGNGGRNRLEGNAGNDLLRGKQGVDVLLGRSGNDTYFFELGHGQDLISEQAGGGFDRIVIQGLRNFDSLEDLAFRKSGDDLQIRLDLDNRDDFEADSITIRKFGQTAFRVERLDLRNDSFSHVEKDWIGQISLQSIYDQSTSEFQRFRMTTGRDPFGHLATLV